MNSPHHGLRFGTHIRILRSSDCVLGEGVVPLVTDNKNT